MAAVIGICYVGYALAERSVIAILIANQRAGACEAKLAAPPPRPGGPKAETPQ